MKYLYNSRNKTIRGLGRYSEEIDLTIYESRLIEVLSNERVNNYYEIEKYVFGENNKHDKDFRHSNLRVVKCNLFHKLNIRIKNIRGRGYMLLDEIYIT